MQHLTELIAGMMVTYRTPSQAALFQTAGLLANTTGALAQTKIFFFIVLAYIGLTVPVVFRMKLCKAILMVMLYGVIFT